MFQASKININTIAVSSTPPLKQKWYSPTNSGDLLCCALWKQPIRGRVVTCSCTAHTHRAVTVRRIKISEQGRSKVTLGHSHSNTSLLGRYMLIVLMHKCKNNTHDGWWNEVIRPLMWEKAAKSCKRNVKNNQICADLYFSAQMWVCTLWGAA